MHTPLSRTCQTWDFARHLASDRKGVVKRAAEGWLFVPEDPHPFNLLCDNERWLLEKIAFRGQIIRKFDEERHIVEHWDTALPVFEKLIRNEYGFTSYSWEEATSIYSALYPEEEDECPPDDELLPSSGGTIHAVEDVEDYRSPGDYYEDTLYKELDEKNEN